jgi:hypothetical protein
MHMTAAGLKEDSHDSLNSGHPRSIPWVGMSGVDVSVVFLSSNRRGLVGNASAADYS